jgi:hypothetical protein
MTMSVLMERQHSKGAVGPSGDVSFNIIRQRSGAEGAAPPKSRGIQVADIWRWATPHRDVSPYPEIRAEINAFRRANAHRLWSMAPKLTVARALGLPLIQSSLWLTVVRADGRVVPLGLAGVKVVTDVGVGYIVDAFQNSVELENMKFHGLGTGSTAENQTDTALVTELTTEYTGNVRATGTTTEGASANIYRTVATNTLDGTPGGALREHGLFSASTVGVLFDRTVYAAITLSSGDGLQSTYDATFSANG